MSDYELGEDFIEPYPNTGNKSHSGKHYNMRDILAIGDVHKLHEIIMEKEREKQHMASDLDMAARLGLAISEANEDLQAKVSYLELERNNLKAELARSLEFKSNSAENNLTGYMEDLRVSNPNNEMSHSLEPMSPIEERNRLRQQLSEAMRELERFHKEMDGLSVQLNDMAVEMTESQTKVGVYSKRLAEVEHTLATTQEMNVNLQILLEKALNSQKQSNASTNHVVRNIQSDISKVLNENSRLRKKINELEEYQAHCENKLVQLVDQAKEYASLLQQAQDAIYQMNEYKYSSDIETSTPYTFPPQSPTINWDNTIIKESEITKGPVFSAEFKHEMQKEIEKELLLRNEIRHRIVKHDPYTPGKQHAAEGLKYLLSERQHLSASNSTSTSSSLASRPKEKEFTEPTSPPAPTLTSVSAPVSASEPVSASTSTSVLTSASLSISNHKLSAGQAPSEPPSIFHRGLQPSTSSSKSETRIGLGGLMPSGGYVLRSMPRGSAGWISSAAAAKTNASVSTKFFRRLADNLNVHDKTNNDELDDIDGL